MSVPVHLAKLYDWLAQHGAICMWEQRVPHVGKVFCYRFGAKIALVLRYDRGVGGWELFVPAHDGLSIASSFAAAEAALDLEKKPCTDSP